MLARTDIICPLWEIKGPTSRAFTYFFNSVVNSGCLTYSHIASHTKLQYIDGSLTILIVMTVAAAAVIYNSQLPPYQTS